MTDEPKRAPRVNWLEAMHANREAAAAAKAKEHAKLERLRQKMLKAHPDQGGSHEAFIKARAAYEKARGWALGGRKS